jgi:hypothetical protein
MLPQQHQVVDLRLIAQEICSISRRLALILRAISQISGIM